MEPLPATPRDRRWTDALWETPPLTMALCLSAIGLVVYWLTGPPADGGMFEPLADAFLHGRLYLVDDRPWLELVPRVGGGQYVPLPPAPALLLMPLEAVRQMLGAAELPDNVPCSFVGAANVGLAYLLLDAWGVAPKPRLWLTLGFAFTTHWWVAGMAGPHHFAETTATFFMLIALNLAVRHRWAAAGGLVLGLAAGSRLPLGLSLPAFLAFYGSGWRPQRAQLQLLAGLALPVALMAAYNVARFGSPIDFGYAHIPSGDTGLITDEPWFQQGLMSISYIPRHLNVMFVQTFHLVAQAPFLKPSWSGAALWLTAPFLFWAVTARGRMVPLLWVTVLLVALPDLLWGSWGFAQFGYRRILDVVPFLLLLLGLRFRQRIGGWAIATVIAGIVVHAYGIYVINVLNFVE
jgi:hypothetical protein